MAIHGHDDISMLCSYGGIIVCLGDNDPPDRFILYFRRCYGRIYRTGSALACKCQVFEARQLSQFNDNRIV
jgi:hypothetical protein